MNGYTPFLIIFMNLFLRIFLSTLLLATNIHLVSSEGRHYTITIWFNQETESYNGGINIDWDGGDTMCSFKFDEENKVACVTDIVLKPGGYSTDHLYNCKINESLELLGETYTVVAIDEWAFSKLKNIKFNAIKLPNTLLEIGKFAFEDMDIKQLEIPESVTEIGEAAFWNAKIGRLKLSSSSLIDFPEVSYIFQNCKGNLYIDCNYTQLEMKNYLSSNHFSSITLESDSSTNVPDFLFYDYYDLNHAAVFDSLSNATGETSFTTEYLLQNASGPLSAKIILTDNITGIGEGSFFRSSIDFRNVVFNENINHIGDWAFCECSYLTEFTLPKDVKEIGTYAFSLCLLLESFDFGNNLEDIFAGAFQDCQSLSNIILPESLNSIGDLAFYQVKECDSLVIPDNVKYIGQHAFNRINSHIVIGSNANEIGKYAFGETRSDLQYLETIRLKNPTPPTISSKQMFNYQYTELIVPIGSLEAYKNADVWKEFSKIREDGEHTAIQGIMYENHKEEIVYDLNGTPVSNPRNGIYIKNGKKIYFN